ncbi:hypothetical protein AK88_01464 [Plasmodium fragile]|uniref:Tryptophan/threonine-rich plasmodium antigen C-terminal domain-containing protein n=1 Tax=Plasmodium fragile TaxID=5857 RepID=A0A0D9QP01_PLAFR|nr:uncharacterized protein AK88_01464 [Plasmodium fragile]KJP88774.1 hypothetical protein AK88_01464 [Plasmodium fragile]
MQKEVRKPKYKVPVVTAEHNRAYNAQQQKLKKTGQADVAVKGQPKKHKFTPSSQKVPRKSFKLEGEKINTVPQGVQQKCVIPKAPVKLQPSTEEQELGSHSIVIEEMIETESVTSDETVETESVLSAGEVTETKYVVGGKKTRIPRFVYSVKAKKDEVKLENESVLIEELTRTKSVVGREKPRIPTFVYSVKAKKDEENLETESVLSAGEATGTKCVVAEKELHTTETSPLEKELHKNETSPLEKESKNDSQAHSSTGNKFNALKYFTTPEPKEDGEKLETKSVAYSEKHESSLYEDDKNSTSSSSIDAVREDYMKYNKYSIPKETVKERENASDSGRQYQTHVLSEQKSIGVHDHEDGNAYCYNQEGMEEGHDEDGSAYCHNQQGMEEGDDEDGNTYCSNQKGMEEADDEDGNTYCSNQKGMEQERHNSHEDGMPIIDANGENLEHEQGKKLRRREPHDANNVDKEKLVLTDYKEWLDQKEYAIVRVVQNLWCKIFNSNFMIRRRYKDHVKDKGMPTNQGWNSWMKKLNNEWSSYNVYIHNERTKWFQQKEIEFLQFIQNFQLKWMHYNKELLQDYSFDFYKKSLKWKDSKWIQWIEKDGESIMMMDIDIWIDQIRAEYNLWQLKAWEQWKNNKILDWLLSEEKCDQYQYWLKWEYSNKKPSLRNEKLDWYKWKKIRQSEAKDWQKWVREKEQALIEVKNLIWQNWKEEKKKVFFSMLNHFIKNWIANKQWKVWILDLKSTQAK